MIIWPPSFFHLLAKEIFNSQKFSFLWLTQNGRPEKLKNFFYFFCFRLTFASYSFTFLYHCYASESSSYISHGIECQMLSSLGQKNLFFARNCEIGQSQWILGVGFVCQFSRLTKSHRTQQVKERNFQLFLFCCLHIWFPRIVGEDFLCARKVKANETS